MLSKKLVNRYIQPLLNAGHTQKDIAKALGYNNPNYLSMLLSEKYETTLISLNRIERLAEVCGLNETEILQLALARVEDAKNSAIEMSPQSLKYLLKSFASLATKKLAGTSTSSLVPA